jgi:hypothetical protein
MSLDRGHFDEVFYSDSHLIKKSWIFNRWPVEKWNFEFSLRIMGHSKNWSMGSLNIDVFSLGIELGPLDIFFAYRLEVFPPPTKPITD